MQKFLFNTAQVELLVKKSLRSQIQLLAPHRKIPGTPDPATPTAR